MLEWPDNYSHSKNQTHLPYFQYLTVSNSNQATSLLAHDFHRGGMAVKKTKRIRKVGSIEDARKELWRAIIRVKEILMDTSTDDPTTLKSAHCMQQCVSSYVRLLEATDLEQRIEKLEATLKKPRG